MASLYPNTRDVFLRWRDDVDDMVVQDLEDLFDGIIAIETELGAASTGPNPWPPSGDFGTITGRLFSRGFFSKLDGGWVPITYERKNGQLGELWWTQGLGAGATFVSGRFAGRDLGWVKDAPIAFAALQGPFTGTLSSGMTHWAKGRPWSLVCVFLDEESARFVAWDGGSGGNSPSAASVWPLDPNVPNSRDSNVGYFFWGMRT